MGDVLRQYVNAFAEEPTQDFPPPVRDYAKEYSIRMRKDLRDEFAKAALTGMLAHPESCAAWQANDTLCVEAYEIADAMLRARDA